MQLSAFATTAKAYDRSANHYICQLPSPDAQASGVAVDNIPTPVWKALRRASCRVSSFAPALGAKEQERRRF